VKWRIELDLAARREIKRLDPQISRRVLSFLYEKVATLDDPRGIGDSLKGPEFGDFWKYRVGDYRIIAKIDDHSVSILVIRVGNRREVYR
jgi:mRNA interferase RelE/StbE